MCVHRVLSVDHSLDRVSTPQLRMLTGSKGVRHPPPPGETDRTTGVFKFKISTCKCLVNYSWIWVIAMLDLVHVVHNARFTKQVFKRPIVLLICFQDKVSCSQGLELLILPLPPESWD